MSGIQYADLLNAALLRLRGVANAFTTDQLLSAINEGKDELWKALVQTGDDYFLQQTVTTPTTAINYFPALVLTTREYSLPADCLRPRFIEVLSPAGFEQTSFVYRNITHPDFVEQRTRATADGPSGSTFNFATAPDQYFYTITGKNQLMLARFPEQAFVTRIWYVRALPDGGQNSSLDETVAPFKSDIVNFAVKRLSAIGKDPERFGIWSQAWRDGIIGTVQTAGPRSDANFQTAVETDY